VDGNKRQHCNTLLLIIIRSLSAYNRHSQWCRLLPTLKSSAVSRAWRHTGVRWDLIVKWTGENALNDLDLSLRAPASLINCWCPSWQASPIVYIIYIILVSRSWRLNVACNTSERAGDTGLHGSRRMTSTHWTSRLTAQWPSSRTTIKMSPVYILRPTGNHGNLNNPSNIVHIWH